MRRGIGNTSRTGARKAENANPARHLHAIARWSISLVIREAKSRTAHDFPVEDTHRRHRILRRASPGAAEFLQADSEIVIL